MYFVFVFMLLISVCFADRNCGPKRGSLPDKTDDGFQQESLREHNNYRAKHHVGPLRIDQNLVKDAKDRCRVISQCNSLEYGHDHVKDENGENLHWQGDSRDQIGSAKYAVEQWYKESEKYDFNKSGYQSGLGHFTQMVWKDTNAVGCARCYGRGKDFWETYVVCEYLPMGNWVNEGEFQRNVLRA